MFRTIVVLALDEIFDNLFFVQSVRIAKQMKGVQGPVHAIDSQVLSKPVLERVLFLITKDKKDESDITAVRERAS